MAPSDRRGQTGPEPLPSNLVELSEAVVANGADFGISVDPDVDRLALICENGKPFGEEYTLVSVADYLLSKAYNEALETGKSLDEVTAPLPSPPIRAPTSFILVVTLTSPTAAAAYSPPYCSVTSLKALDEDKLEDVANEYGAVTSSSDFPVSKASLYAFERR